MKSRSSASVRVVLAVALALLALAGVHGESAATSKITISPALAEAVANGEVSEMPTFTATPVESQWKDTSSGSSSAAATTTAAPSTITPVIITPATSAPASSSGEVAVDTFKSNEALSGSKSGGSNGLLIAVGAVGAVAAVAMAVVYKRRTAKASDTDDADDQHQSQQHPQPSQGRGVFESADYTPGKPSLDGMLQDDRLTTGSSTMMPVFSAADRMSMSAGIVRLSSPFGAKGARISSPAVRVNRSTDNMEFSTGSQRGHTTTTAGGETIVHIKPEMAL